MKTTTEDAIMQQAMRIALDKLNSIKNEYEQLLRAQGQWPTDGGMTECHPACEQLGFIPQSEFLRSKSFTSRGTKYTIDYATKVGKPMKIVKV